MPHSNPVRKTKIVATVGPACDDVETLEAMMRAGMNVTRLNLSHGTMEEHASRVGRIRAAAQQAGTEVAVMVDTRGIEIRTGRIPGGALELKPDAPFTLYTDARPGDENGVSVSYQGLTREVNPGEPVLLDDGAMELLIETIAEREIHCRVVSGGTLLENKGVNLPDTHLSLSAVDPQNREDVVREMSFAAKNDVDYIAASFVQDADDVNRMREVLFEHGVQIPIIAKIENKAGVRNLEAIVAAADGVMVARGDMGVELPLADVPGVQKKIIRTTVTNGKPVITATQMLASMEQNPKPTRAEASDVANAILDGSSAVMLSGETAVGRYPIDAVRTMANLAERTEQSLREYGFLQHILPHASNVVTEAVSEAATRMALQLGAVCVISLTETGFTSRLISKHRPECPILAVTSSVPVARRLCMNWGVLPVVYQGEPSDDEKVALALSVAADHGIVSKGSIVISTAGRHKESGGTNVLRVLTTK